MTPRQLAMLLSLAALWGASFLFMRVAVPSFGPIVLADARVALAGVVLLGYAAAIGARPALRERWRDYLLLGSDQRRAAVLAARRGAARDRGVAGGGAERDGAAVRRARRGGLAGRARRRSRRRPGSCWAWSASTLVVGLSPFTIDAEFVLAVLACLAAAFAYGVGANIVRVRFVGEPPLSMAVGQQLAAAVVLLPLIPALPVRATPDAVDVLCVLALALGSTGIAYLLYFRLLRELGATGGMTVIFVVPVFGVLWGALFLDERIHLGTVLGGAVILLSVWLITRTPASERAAAELRAGQLFGPMNHRGSPRCAVRDADVAVVRLRPAHAEPLAVLAEQPADVGREVGEEVARILVLGTRPLGSFVLKRLMVRQPSLWISPQELPRVASTTRAASRRARSALCLRRADCGKPSSARR